MNRRTRSKQTNRLAFEILESRRTLSASPLRGAMICMPDRGGGPHELEAGGKAAGAAKAVYTYSVTGNAANANITLPAASAGLALVGGGTDVDAVFNWMGRKANGGDFLVLRATGTNAYNSYIAGLDTIDTSYSLDSVATLVIPNGTAANNQDVANLIQNAEAIFIAGGDQANYANYWTNTGVENALYAALQRNVPIGGTSAGLAILGDVDFAARLGTIDSSQALANPYNSLVDLHTTLVTPNDVSGTSLQFMDNVITDSHFQQRDRMGRLVTFLARMDTDNQVPDAPRGIAVNEQTALLVDWNGNAQVVGNPYSTNKKVLEVDQQRNVYLVQGVTSAANVVAPNVPLTYSVQVQKANYNPKTGIGDTFSLSTWTLTNPVLGVNIYTVAANSGTLTSSLSSGSIYG